MTTNNTVYNGSFSILDGVDTALYGFGDLYVTRNLETHGTVQLLSVSDSIISVAGGNLSITTSDTGDIIINSVRGVNVDGGVITVDATSDSNFTVANNNLTLSTTTAGDVIISAVDNATVDAGAISLDATSDSNFTVANNDLTLATTTAGDVNLSAAGIVNVDGNSVTVDAVTSVSVDAAAASNFTVAGANLTLATTTSGDVIVAAAGIVNVDGNSVTVDAVTSVSVDAAAASNFTVTGGNLTLSTATSGDVIVTGTDNVTVTAGSDVVINTVNLDVNSSTFTVDATSDSAINVTSGDLSLTTTTAGTVIVNSAGAVDIDGAAASSFNVTSANLTLSTTTSGNISVSSAGTATITAPTGITLSNDVTASSDLTVNNNLSVLGNATVDGNFTVNGTTTTINTETLLVEDNLIGMNNAPAAAGRDSGIHLSRHHSDVTLDTATATGTAQAAATASITLASDAGVTDDAFNQWYISITAGVGVGQIRQVADYTGATKVAAVTSDWVVVPSDTSVYALFNRPYTAFVYDESADEWVLGYTTDPASSATVSIASSSQYGTLHVGNLVVENAISGGNIFNEIVNVIDNASTPSNIVNTDFRGSYFIIVESSDQGGACATFVASSRSSDAAGQINRLTESRSVTNERIQAQWTANNRVQLYHQVTKTGGVGANLPYKVVITKAQ